MPGSFLESTGGSVFESAEALLEYLAKDFPKSRLIDPANSNNIVSECLTQEQKQSIAEAANQSRKKETWPEIL